MDISLLAALAVYAPVALAGYLISYMLMIIVLRFVDGLEHDYPYRTNLYTDEVSEHKGDLEWEQEHTFSNPLSIRYPKLNWLVLNFGYHSAHHADMDKPFFRLPELHRELAGNNPARVIPLGAQLSLYHRNRVRRVYNPQPEGYPKGEAYLAAAQTGRAAVGGNAASFLTSF